MKKSIANIRHEFEAPRKADNSTPRKIYPSPLTPDERRLLDEYRKAKSRREVLHVVTQSAAVKIYRFKQEAASTTSIFAYEEQRETVSV